MSASKDKSRNCRASTRRFAEWVSMIISAAVILALAIYLVVQAVQSNDPFVPVETRAELEKVDAQNGQYILPVYVHNVGSQTLRDLKVQITFLGENGEQEEDDVLIDYLGEQSEQRAYFYFDRDPATLNVEVRPLSYRVR